MAPQTPPAAPRRLDAFAALLSFLIPGLGQIYQGRVAKGILFLVCLLGLFFYGMRLGSWENVYLPDTDTKQNMLFAWKPLGDVENRPHFAGQLFIGIAAWPAIVQYARFDPQEAKEKQLLKGWQRTPSADRLNELQRDGDKRWDLGWVYSVVAGVLNLLVIYDALAGPAHREHPELVASAKDKVAS